MFRIENTRERALQQSKRESLRIRWARILALLLLTASGCSDSSPVAVATDIDASTVLALIPSSDTTADVISVLPLTDRVAELGLRFERAISQDLAWWAEYSSSPGSLPYHPKMGLTETEYIELGNAMDAAKVGIVGEAIVSSEVRDDGRHGIRIVLENGERIDLRIDPASLEIESVFGVAGPPEPWSTSNADSYLGPAHGWRWENVDPSFEESTDTASGTAIRVTLGIRESDGRTFLAIKGVSAEENSQFPAINIDLLFDTK